jgi:hypothetical protein
MSAVDCLLNTPPGSRYHRGSPCITAHLRMRRGVLNPKYVTGRRGFLPPQADPCGSARAANPRPGIECSMLLAPRAGDLARVLLLPSVIAPVSDLLHLVFLTGVVSGWLFWPTQAPREGRESVRVQPPAEWCDAMRIGSHHNILEGICLSRRIRLRQKREGLASPHDFWPRSAGECRGPLPDSFRVEMFRDFGKKNAHDVNVHAFSRYVPFVDSGQKCLFDGVSGLRMAGTENIN